MLKLFDYVTLIILVSYLIGNFINVNYYKKRLKFTYIEIL